MRGENKYGVYVRVDERDIRCPPFARLVLGLAGIVLFAWLAAAPIWDGMAAYAGPILDAWDAMWRLL